jgi:hypothetical protein
VVRGWPCLAPATAHGLRSVLRAGITCSLIDASIVVSRGLLAALFAPFLATLGALLGILNGDVERCSPAVAWGRAKLDCFGADDMKGGDAMPFFDGTLRGIGRCLERPQQ